MDPLSRLPVECLEQILQCISSFSAFQARPALAALCKVNRHISRTTIFFLYNDPFRLTDDRVLRGKAPRLSRALIRSLVVRLPTTQVHPALLLGLNIPPYTTATTTNDNSSNTKTSPGSMLPTSRSVDYHSLIRHLNIDPLTFLEYSGAKNFKSNYAEEQAYIHTHAFLDMYLKDREDATCVAKSQSSLLPKYYPNVLHREATWTLAAPILDQLVSLTILLSDLDRYHQLVDRLGRLEHIVVYLDLVFACYCCMRSSFEFWRNLRKEDTMRQLVQFVKDHIKLYPGRLKTVSTYNSPFWNGAGPQSCPKEIQQEIFRMLPSSYMPEYISTYNWEKISTFLMTTDLSRVQTIRLLQPYSWFGPAVDHQNILQRCRALTQLDVHCLVRNCFDWAVQEKKDFDSRHIGTGGSSSPRGRLVALSKVTIQQLSMPLQDLDALAFAFSKTLEHLDIKSFSGLDLRSPVHMGRGWLYLRHLRILKLHAPKHRLALDPLLLDQCPSLTELKITDETYEYS
ncbi:MAG: hypothetical protein JOS17DRAFT_152295 [Linnemannia elongata]|nr:MAG: hypothetical protein JOS17DRAFT_152295 [Linnemannia elongata]